MKNLKKVLSVVLTVAMLISSFAALSVSAAEYGDVDATNSYYKAIKVLSGLGVVKGDEVGNFNPTSDIKRSEMVALVCRALGEEAVALSSGGATFDDVSADHWAAGYIAWGVAGNIVNGVGDNKFDPDASVKFQDAVVMVLRALGYERIAQRPENGGYPTGYLKIASQRGVLAGTNFDGATAGTREVVAQVIYNALTTPLVDVSYYAPNPADDEYVVYDGKNGTDLRTLLTWTNEIYKVKAVVENTAKTDEKLRKEADAPKVELYLTGAYDYAWADILDGDYKAKSTITPYVGDTDVADYLGYTVEAYIAENDDEEWELQAVVVDSKSTDSETVSENFEAYEEGTFEYYVDLNDARTTKIDLVAEDDLDIYYNGSLIDADDVDTLTKGKGLEYLLVEMANSITFMGPKNDDYNKIFVTDYAYKQVESVRAEEEFVKFTTGAVSLDKDERGDDTFLYNLYDAEGNAITLEDVQEDDLFNIVAPLVDGEANQFDKVPYMDIYVTNNVVEGSVTEMIKKDETYVIAGDKYDVDENATIKVGDEGIFYITIDGLVYDSDAASVVNKNYSFIAAYGSDASFGVNTHQLKLFTVDGALETYDVASSLKVYEGNEYKTYKRNDKTQDDFFKGIEEKVADEDSKAEAIEKLSGRLVTFKLNSSNEITELRFAGVQGKADFFVKREETAKYSEKTNMFAKWDLDDNSKLFVAPVTEIAEGAWNVDEEDIELASFAGLDEEKVGGYDVFTFNFDKADYLGAALSGVKISSTMKKSHLAVVKTKSTGIDADGSDVDKYTFVQSGEILTKSVDYDAMTEVDSMSIGDVFRYVVDADDEIEETEVYYKAASRKFDAGEWELKDYDANDIAIVYGNVAKIKGNKLYLGETEETAEVYSMNETEGNTYALVDEVKMAGNNPSSAVKALSGASYIKDSYGSYTYYVVALYGEDSALEDIVQIQWATEGK